MVTADLVANGHVPTEWLHQRNKEVRYRHRE